MEVFKSSAWTLTYRELRERARFVAAFAYILGRVAHADQQISAEETAMQIGRASNTKSPAAARDSAKTAMGRGAGFIMPK